ncbi:MAG: glycosyltransferase [Elusimicrobia bacterium]|nr:glycosyltransferase [Elusimicrobiota bacterium]
MAVSPLFSIIIPTYNRARAVAAAVRSVLSQTEGDFECFVMDDGSTDGTAAVLAGFTDPRLRVVLNAVNRGQHACRNDAIRAAKGEWICFLDSDDLFLPRRLAQLRNAIEREPRAGFWFTNAYIHRYGRLIGTLFDPRRSIPEGRVPGYYAVGDAFLPYVTTMVCVRRRAFEEIGLFREDLTILEDTELYARMLKSGVYVGALKEPLAVRFLHEGQITGDYETTFKEALEALRSAEAPAEIVEFVRKRVVRESATYFLKSLQARKARELLRKEIGPGARGTALYWETFIPAAALGLLKRLRELYLSARYHPALAPAELSEAARAIEPFLR